MPLGGIAFDLRNQSKSNRNKKKINSILSKSSPKYGWGTKIYILFISRQNLYLAFDLRAVELNPA